MADVFNESLAQWQACTQSPWARIRYATVAEVLRRQCEALGARLRVLDVGGGDAADALPMAKAGREVTIVDPAQAWLSEALRRANEEGVGIHAIRAGLDDLPDGEWGLVLCHFVMRYRPADADDLAALASRVRAGGRLSVMDVSPVGHVLRTLLTDGPSAAASALGAERIEVKTFQTDARKVGVDRVQTHAGATGLTTVALHGHRIANDLLPDNAAALLGTGMQMTGYVALMLASPQPGGVEDDAAAIGLVILTLPILLAVTALLWLGASTGLLVRWARKRRDNARTPRS